MRATIHTTELRSWQERANRNEIIISGMSFPYRGKVELDYHETPRLAENLTQAVAQSGRADVARPLSESGGQPSDTGSNPVRLPTLGTPVPPVPLAIPAPVTVPPLPESNLMRVGIAEEASGAIESPSIEGSTRITRLQSPDSGGSTPPPAPI